MVNTPVESFEPPTAPPDVAIFSSNTEFLISASPVFQIAPPNPPPSCESLFVNVAPSIFNAPFSATFIAPPSLFPVITLFVNSASLTPVKSNSAPAPTKIRVLSLAVNLSATNVVTPSESMFLYSSWKSTGTDCFTIFRVELVNKILSAEIFAPSTVKSALFAASAPAVFVASRFANDHKTPANSLCS